MINKFILPEPIEMHIRAANEDNPAAFLSTFCEDAIVLDAGKEYRGNAAIKKWSDGVYFKDHLRLKITNAVQDVKEIVVTAKAEGAYDKTGLPDPLFLDFHFILDGGKVSILRIVLSSNSKAVPLPPPIAAFYHSSDVYDNDFFADCFADDAVLQDEGDEYHGPAAISGHILKANRDAKVSMEITKCIELNEIIIVTATLTGEFEGSPIPLDFHFTLDNGKIKTLNITLEGEI